MRSESFQRLSAFCGISGVVMLVTSFAINPGLGPNPTAHDLIVFGTMHRTTILLGAWLQAISPFLIMIFALASIRLVRANDCFLAHLTQVGFVVLVMVSLLEVVFYLSAVYGDPATTGLISLDLIHGTQHLFSIAAAPAVFFPFGFLILQTAALPRIFGYTGLALGTLFTMLGLAALFLPIQHMIDGLASVQGLWWLLAAAVQVFRSPVGGLQARSS